MKNQLDVANREYDYDAAGRVTRESNRGLATQYEYDQNCNRTLMVDPSGGRFTTLFPTMRVRF